MNKIIQALSLSGITDAPGKITEGSKSLLPGICGRPGSTCRSGKRKRYRIYFQKGEIDYIEVHLIMLLNTGSRDDDAAGMKKPPQDQLSVSFS